MSTLTVVESVGRALRKQPRPVVRTCVGGPNVSKGTVALAPGKRCSRCGNTKSYEAFYVRRLSPDGFNAACKACIDAARRARWDQRLEREGRERIYNRPVVDGRKQCTSCREWKPVEGFYDASNRCVSCVCATEGARSFRKRYPHGKQLVLFGVTLDEQRRKAVARATAWNLTHPEVTRAATRRRRARLGGKRLPGITRAAIAERMRFFGNRCWICDAPQEQVDHVKPIAKGGAHMFCNLRPICPPCNVAKSARWPFDVAAFRLEVSQRRAA